MTNPAAPLQTFGFVSVDAQIALTEFGYDFLEAFKASPTPFAERLGLVRFSQFLQTRFPMPVDAAEFREFYGEIGYRRLGHKSLTVTPGVWSDGVEELARVIEAPEFLGWMEAPGEQADDASALPDRLAAKMLLAGKTTPSWEVDDGSVMWFDKAHPINPMKPGGGGPANPISGQAAGTYPNLLVGMPLDFDSIRKVRAHFRKWPAVSGAKRRGLRLTDILAHPDQEQQVMELRREKYVMRKSVDGAGQTVGYMFAPNENASEEDYAFNVWIGEELTESGVWYPMSLNRRGTKPWVIQRRLIPGGVGMPAGWTGTEAQPPAGGLFEVIVNDKASQKYKDTGLVSIGHKLEMGMALAHPWSTLRCEPSGTAEI
jgi:hypothetical protein